MGMCLSVNATWIGVPKAGNGIVLICFKLLNLIVIKRRL